MTFNQLKEYHLKNLSVILKSGKVVQGIITSHHWNSLTDEVESISILCEWTIEKIDCVEIQEIEILEDIK